VENFGQGGKERTSNHLRIEKTVLYTPKEGKKKEKKKKETGGGPAMRWLMWCAKTTGKSEGGGVDAKPFVSPTVKTKKPQICGTIANKTSRTLKEKGG